MSLSLILFFMIPPFLLQIITAMLCTQENVQPVIQNPENIQFTVIYDKDKQQIIIPVHLFAQRP